VAGGGGEDAGMAQFTSYDGTKLAFRRAGAGRPLVCLPGGPGRTPDYLGDLGGLDAWRELILPDTRGTGESAVPADPVTYRCDLLARDVEALRAELGLERFDLLGHSAGGSVALRYAGAYPERIGHLVLLSPGMGPLGLAVTDAQQQAAMRRRSGEPWYQEARAAAQAADAGDGSAETRLRYMPFFYGRWDDAARAHALVGFSERARVVQAGFYAPGGFDPPATRAGLARVTAPVMMYVGQAEIGPTPELAAEAAGLFPGWELTVQPGAGHYPWLDDPAWFTARLLDFLG
jgi:pimeloyl-ACP methyl ester carboxylesterase